VSWLWPLLHRRAPPRRARGTTRQHAVAIERRLKWRTRLLHVASAAGASQPARDIGAVQLKLRGFVGETPIHVGEFRRVVQGLVFQVRALQRQVRVDEEAGQLARLQRVVVNSVELQPDPVGVWGLEWRGLRYADNCAVGNSRTAATGKLSSASANATFNSGAGLARTLSYIPQNQSLTRRLGYDLDFRRTHL